VREADGEYSPLGFRRDIGLRKTLPVKPKYTDIADLEGTQMLYYFHSSLMPCGSEALSLENIIRES
jgi:hypothetical protein